MLKVTTWAPDTCGCVIDYEWDDAVPEASRIHTLKAVKSACPHHKGLPGGMCFETVLEENIRKNKAIVFLHQDLVAAYPDIYEGEAVKVMVEKAKQAMSVSDYLELSTPEKLAEVKRQAQERLTGEIVKWSFDANRSLILSLTASFSPLSAAVKAIHSKLDAAFGVGKVKIDG